jgi:hypothetical protein
MINPRSGRRGCESCPGYVSHLVLVCAKQRAMWSCAVVSASLLNAAISMVICCVCVCVCVRCRLWDRRSSGARRRCGRSRVPTSTISRARPYRPSIFYPSPPVARSPFRPPSLDPLFLRPFPPPHRFVASHQPPPLIVHRPPIHRHPGIHCRHPATTSQGALLQAPPRWRHVHQRSAAQAPRLLPRPPARILRRQPRRRF